MSALPQYQESCLVFAMRYALPRATGATCIVQSEIKRLWPQLKQFTKHQIKLEIEGEFRRGDVPVIEKPGWQQILDL